MAGKVVDVTLKLVDKLTSPLQRLNGNLKQSAGQWIKAGQQIQKAGNNIAKTGTSLTKKVTAPVVTAGTACVKLAADFEKGMSTVQSISGATGEELDKLSKKAKEMGQKTKFSATEATEAYKYMAMAGWKSGQMLDGISGIMYLAGATGEDLASTSDIVTDSLTAFGMSAKDTNTFVDVLAKTANTSNTNVGMLGESFKYVAPVAGALGYKVQDVSVALGLMANNGIKASQAGTSVRSWLSRMADPTDKVAAAMKKLGISLTDSHGNMKSMDKLMRETRTAFDGLSKAQKSQYASTLAGKSGMSGLLAIVNSSDKDFENLTKEIEDEEIDVEVEEETVRSDYEINFETGELTGRIITGLDAIKQWVKIVLLTDRYRYPQYSWDHGGELSTLIGQGYDEAYVKSEVKRMIEDAILIDEDIIGIEDLTCSMMDDRLSIHFYLNTIYGGGEVDV